VEENHILTIRHLKTQFFTEEGVVKAVDDVSIHRTNSIGPGIRHPDLGFRLVREPKKGDWTLQTRRLVAVSRGNGEILLGWGVLSDDHPNQAFNVTNGDFIRWQNLWPRFADLFGMQAGPVKTVRLAQVMADKAPVWERIIGKHGLRPTPYEQAAAWPYGDFNFGRGYDTVRDLAAVSVVSASPNVLVVHPSVPARSVQELIALADAVIKAARSADTTQRLLDLGAEPIGYTPEEAARFLREEVALWAAVVKASGARAD